MTATIKIGDYYVHERELENGWYLLSTMAYGVDEWYEVHKRYDHKTGEEDYKDFVRYVEGTR